MRTLQSYSRRGRTRLPQGSDHLDELSGIVKYGPSMPGAKLGPKLPYFFDIVMRLGIGKDTTTQQEFRFLQTQPDLQYEAKDRSGALSPVEPPHLGHVFNKILAS